MFWLKLFNSLLSVVSLALVGYVVYVLVLGADDVFELSISWGYGVFALLGIVSWVLWRKTKAIVHLICLVAAVVLLSGIAVDQQFDVLEMIDEVIAW